MASSAKGGNNSHVVGLIAFCNNGHEDDYGSVEAISNFSGRSMPRVQDASIDLTVVSVKRNPGTWQSGVCVCISCRSANPPSTVSGERDMTDLFVLA